MLGITLFRKTVPFFAATALFLSFPFYRVEALGLGIFGGIINTQIPCTSPQGAFLTVVGLPTPGSFLYFPVGSILYRNYKPFTGSWSLGDYQIFPSVCVIGVCPYCAIIPTLGIIKQIGTS